MSTIAHRILNGEADSEFAAIRAAMKQRSKALAAVRVASYSPGDKVRFSSEVRPKYLAGQEAVVKRVLQSNVVVDLVQPAGRFSTDIRVPATLLQ